MEREIVIKITRFETILLFFIGETNILLIYREKENSENLITYRIKGWWVQSLRSDELTAIVPIEYVILSWSNRFFYE